MNTKQFARVDVKDADRGEVVAVFSTLDAVDSDGDVTLPGAFTDGEPVRISAYGHASWQGALPVGKGTIREVGDEAVLEGRFFLHTTHGRDTFETVKELAGLQEWSYGFDILEKSDGERDGRPVRFLKKLKVHEVSPVLLGAGVNTRTLAVKRREGLKFSEHADAVMADVRGLIDRATEIVALRAGKGKGLAPESADLLAVLDGELKRLGALLEHPPDLSDELLSEYLRFVASEQGVVPQ